MITYLRDYFPHTLNKGHSKKVLSGTLPGYSYALLKSMAAVHGFIY